MKTISFTKLLCYCLVSALILTTTNCQTDDLNQIEEEQLLDEPVAYDLLSRQEADPDGEILIGFIHSKTGVSIVDYSEKEGLEILWKDVSIANYYELNARALIIPLFKPGSAKSSVIISYFNESNTKYESLIWEISISDQQVSSNPEVFSGNLSLLTDHGELIMGERYENNILVEQFKPNVNYISARWCFGSCVADVYNNSGGLLGLICSVACATFNNPNPVSAVTCAVCLGAAAVHCWFSCPDAPPQDPCEGSSDPCCGVNCATNYYCDNGTCLLEPGACDDCPRGSICSGSYCIPI